MREFGSPIRDDDFDDAVVLSDTEVNRSRIANVLRRSRSPLAESVRTKGKERVRDPLLPVTRFVDVREKLYNVIYDRSNDKDDANGSDRPSQPT